MAKSFAGDGWSGRRASQAFLRAWTLTSRWTGIQWAQIIWRISGGSSEKWWKVEVSMVSWCLAVNRGRESRKFAVRDMLEGWSLWRVKDEEKMKETRGSSSLIDFNLDRLRARLRLIKFQGANHDILACWLLVALNYIRQVVELNKASRDQGFLSGRFETSSGLSKPLEC